ncbi:glucan endo-1,3-beta-glucosidase B-like [Hibiscus syriacus]|uniref:Glucan endo-1,3-beta-glucosidase B-like n=1 Tax=Hibiscus syriacus TaxID=106335 RepID=A0A6A3BPN3_HIBSY|nr:zinc finger CCHC domain-containing protein 10-like [Hibiscus syriacus]KAE8717791.1 glucan endo-1,3-beta-glucosidase B-like [Hibiscus syriacus]
MIIKQEKSQGTADKIKAAAVSGAKGLSHAQAARNVNANGKKEEGPSRQQEKREAKRQMSTEKAGERKDKASISTTMATSQCQKCFQAAHWAYECKNPKLRMKHKNPKLGMKLSISIDLDIPDGKDNKDDDRSKKSKRKYPSDSGTGIALSVTGSQYSTEGSSTDYTLSSESEEEMIRPWRKGKRKKIVSSSSESTSDSDF